MKHQILISTYHKDFIWLGPNLASLRKFQSDAFLPPVINVVREDYMGARSIVDREFPEALVLVKDGPEGKGNLRAQIAMMNGDNLCPHADFIWLVGSDCITHSPLTPEFFFEGEKPVLQMNSYEHLLPYAPGIQPWQDGVEAVLGWKPEFEYMRRLPLIYPRDLFRFTRVFVTERHGLEFEDYVYGIGNDGRAERSDAANFSESNVLGAWAHKFRPDMFHFKNLDGLDYDGTNPMIQFWSHGGLDHPCDCRVDYPGGNTFGKTPRAIIKEILATA